MITNRMYTAEIETTMTMHIPEYNNLKGKMKEPITEKQKAYLRSLGVNTTGIRYKGQASYIITVALRRQKCGLASFQQIQKIRSLGIVPTVPFDRLTSIGATRIINRR